MTSPFVSCQMCRYRAYLTGNVWVCSNCSTEFDQCGSVDYLIEEVFLWMEGHTRGFERPEFVVLFGRGNAVTLFRTDSPVVAIYIPRGMNRLQIKGLVRHEATHAYLGNKHHWMVEGLAEHVRILGMNEKEAACYRAESSASAEKVLHGFHLAYINAESRPTTDDDALYGCCLIEFERLLEEEGLESLLSRVLAIPAE